MWLGVGEIGDNRATDSFPFQPVAPVSLLREKRGAVGGSDTALRGRGSWHGLPGLRFTID